MLKAVAFDMDDTLLSINLTAFIAVFARDEARLLADIGRKSPLSALAGLGGVLHDLNANARDEDDARTNRAYVDDEIERRLGIPLGDPVIADAFEYYEREVLPRRNDGVIAARPRPGAHKAVEEVVGRGLRIALEELGLEPHEVLMVGNDPKRDIPFPDCGIQTAYVGRGTPPRATWCGSMEDFARNFDEVEERFYARAEREAGGPR